MRINKIWKMLVCILPGFVFSASSSWELPNEEFCGYERTAVYDATSGHFIGKIVIGYYSLLHLSTEATGYRLDDNTDMDLSERFVTAGWQEMGKIKIAKLVNGNKVIRSSFELLYDTKFSKLKFKSVNALVIAEMKAHKPDEKSSEASDKEAANFSYYPKSEEKTIAPDAVYPKSKVVCLSGNLIGEIRQDKYHMEKLFCEDGMVTKIADDGKIIYKQEGELRVAYLVAEDQVIKGIFCERGEVGLLAPFGTSFRFDTVTAVNIPLEYEKLTPEEMYEICRFLKKAGFEEPEQYIKSSSASRRMVKYACDKGLKPSPDPIECRPS